MCRPLVPTTSAERPQLTCWKKAWTWQSFRRCLDTRTSVQQLCTTEQERKQRARRQNFLVFRNPTETSARCIRLRSGSRGLRMVRKQVREMLGLLDSLARTTVLVVSLGTALDALNHLRG